MLRIGITGGIGSGKSTVCRVFRVLGVPVFEADAEGRRLLSEPRVMAEVAAVFGSAAYREGSPDREFLAHTVFGDPSARARLNGIIHPAVRAAFVAWSAEQRAPYVLMESAILVGSGGAALLDGLVLVTAPEAVRVRRTMLRDGVDEDAVHRRMAAQDEENVMRSAAAHVIDNGGGALVIPQVLHVHRELTQHAGA